MSVRSFEWLLEALKALDEIAGYRTAYDGDHVHAVERVAPAEGLPTRDVRG